MYIHPDLYQEIQNIHKRKDKTDFERFTLKKEAIEKTKTTLGAIISEEQPKHKEKNVDVLICENLKQIEKIKYLHDFFKITKESLSFPFLIRKILSISQEYEDDLKKAPKGYVSKDLLLNLITFYLSPFCDIYKREILKKDINRCRVSIESASSKELSWNETLSKAKDGFFKTSTPESIKREMIKIICSHTHKNNSTFSHRNITTFYNSILKYVCYNCCFSMEYDKRNGVPQKEIDDYFEKNFPFKKNIFDRYLKRYPISKEYLEAGVYYEEFVRENKNQDTRSYIYGGVFYPAPKNKIV